MHPHSLLKNLIQIEQCKPSSLGRLPYKPLLVSSPQKKHNFTFTLRPLALSSLGSSPLNGCPLIEGCMLRVTGDISGDQHGHQIYRAADEWAPNIHSARRSRFKHRPTLDAEAIKESHYLYLAGRKFKSSLLPGRNAYCNLGKEHTPEAE